MDNKNLTTIYYKGKEYWGLNFKKGIKECPNCKKNMNKKPIEQMFTYAPDGCVLVKLTHTGILTIEHTKIESGWFCENCSFMERVSTPKPL